jgi:lysophospholipase L1-like esterase
MSARTTSGRILALAAVNAAVLGAGLVVLELIFGGWVHAGRLDGLNLICDVAIEYRLHGLYPSDSDTALYTRDAWCLRGGPDRAGEIDLLTMGGSTTDQRYIPDGATWQDVLQEELRRSGSPVRVANAGVDGQSTYGHLASFEHWLPAIDGLRPKWILFYVGVNDLFKSADFADDRLLGERDPDAPLLQRLKRAIRKRSAFYRLYRTVRGVVQAHAYGLDHRYADPFAGEGWVEEPLLSDHASVLAPQRGAYARRLRRLCQRTRELGARPIFVTQPSRVYKREAGRVRGTAKTLAVGDLRFNGARGRPGLRCVGGRPGDGARLRPRGGLLRPDPQHAVGRAEDRALPVCEAATRAGLRRRRAEGGRPDAVGIGRRARGAARESTY